ncbi:MFS transporter [Chengkuizengella axinellae]|uniref:MFS transporter n=1 Tax=Chengkuizengella axinellae TaxID=3064388 RepID=A0ABT9J0V3_9BACL|nr:MFS transporter [Chengkuizengella sp. 2205SS18-9]MDP5275227.1 MFS transporter [Chengkuizengella sp. 2205SS18-9]
MRQNIINVKIISIITALALLGDSMLYIVLPIYWKEMGLHSLWEVGILLSVNRFVRLPMNPMIGWLYQRIHFRNGMTIAVLLASLTTFLYSLEGFWLLFTARCMWGIAWSFFRIGAFFFIMNVSNDGNRGRFMGTYNGLYRLGSLFGMLFGGVLAVLFNVSVVSILFSILSFTGLIFIFKYIDPSIKTSNHLPKSGHITGHMKRLIWNNQHVFWTLTTGLVIAMIYQGLFTSTLSYLIHTLHGNVMYWGISFGAAAIAGVIQALRWSWEPWLAPWFGRKSDGPKGRQPLLVGTLICSALLFSLLPLQLHFIIWLIVLIGIQMTATILTTLIDALALDAANQTTQRESVVTFHSVATDIGAALGPLLGYFVYSYLDMKWIYWAVGFILILITLRWMFPWKKQQNTSLSNQNVSN